MVRKSVVILGAEIARRHDVSAVAGQFGWVTEVAPDLDGLAKLGAARHVVAVLAHPAALDLSWKQALTVVSQAIPGAAVILCQRFSEAVDWAEASAEGVFSLLHLPLDPRELRQSLGFLWAARRKRLHVIRTGAARASKQVA